MQQTGKDPASGRPLRVNELYPNLALRDIIQEWTVTNARALDPGVVQRVTRQSGSEDGSGTPDTVAASPGILILQPSRSPPVHMGLQSPATCSTNRRQSEDGAPSARQSISPVLQSGLSEIAAGCEDVDLQHRDTARRLSSGLSQSLQRGKRVNPVYSGSFSEND